MLAFESPNNRDMKAFTSWCRTRMPFRGSSWHLLDKEEDLMSLKPLEEPDRLSTLVEHNLDTT
jgi:hypothetical protein